MNSSAVLHGKYTETRKLLARGEFQTAASLMAGLRQAFGDAPEIDLLDADLALRLGDEEKSSALIARMIRRQSLDPGLAKSAALLARSMDRNDLAVAIVEATPTMAGQAQLSAQFRQEQGEPVADRLAASLRSDDQAGLLQLAGALHAEGRADEAIERLSAAVKANPLWIEGQQVLARLRWQSGEGPDAHRGFSQAVSAHPQNEVLWAAWLGSLRVAGDIAAALEVLRHAYMAAPSSGLIAMIGAEILSEAGHLPEADRAFAQVNGVEDPAFDAARMRHAIRYGRFPEAVTLGHAAVRRHGSGECWAWLATAWRALGDGRAEWFYGQSLTDVVDLDFAPGELEELAFVLRQLHSDRAHPLGQSPRGGTQTMAPLLKRADPAIRGLRSKLVEAVRSFIAGLPAPDPNHPFLRQRRNGFLVAGAWSVRLSSQGHHVSHIHSHGWISSALYVSLPDGMTDAADRSGWLEIGTPPFCSGEKLPPIASVAPRAGRLALFPSLFWHGTRPFAAGERLTVAFDIVPR